MKLKHPGIANVEGLRIVTDFSQQQSFILKGSKKIMNNRQSIMDVKTNYHALLGEVFKEYLYLIAQKDVDIDLKQASADIATVSDFRDYLHFCKHCPDMDVEWLQHDLMIEYN